MKSRIYVRRNGEVIVRKTGRIPLYALAVIGIAALLILMTQAPIYNVAEAEYGGESETVDAFEETEGLYGLSGVNDTYTETAGGSLETQDAVEDPPLVSAGVPKGYFSIPEELLELLDRNPETKDFVYGYPDNFDKYAYLRNDEIDVSGDYTAGEIPHFIQWDVRWGYKQYDGTGSVMGISGCGPTTLSMTVMHLTGDTSRHPAFMADFLYINGFASESGTEWTAFAYAAEVFGLNMRVLPADENVIRNALNGGELVIVSLKPGIFTQVGHFILLTGTDENGHFTIKDSNSYIRTDKAWEPSVIISDARNFWAFSK